MSTPLLSDFAFSRVSRQRLSWTHALRNSVLCVLLSGTALTADFFVAANGNDLAPGTSPASAWRTLARVQLAQSSLLPGDRVLFRCGDRFEGSLTLTSSGAALAPLVLGSYGSGPRPILAGSTAVTGWVSNGGKKWSAQLMPGAAHPEALFDNDVPIPLGREPDVNEGNGGYRFIQSHVGQTILVDDGLSSAPDWSGGEAVIRTQRWILDRVRIQNVSGNTMTLVGAGTPVYEIQDAFGYFVQDHPLTLDQRGEWCFLPSTQTIQIFLPTGVHPAQLNLTVPVENIALQLLFADHWRIQNLDFRGARDSLVRLVQSDHNLFWNNALQGAAKDGIRVDGCTDVAFFRNTVKDCQNNGLTLTGVKRCLVLGNDLKGIGNIAGMGQGPDGNYFGIIGQGDDSVFAFNKIAAVGYVPIGLTGTKNSIHHNRISEFCSVKDDGGGIYVSGYGPNGTAGTSVAHNLVSEGIGAQHGAYPLDANSAHGVYIDDFASGVDVLQNTASDCNGYGIVLHNAKGTLVQGNTCFANKRAQFAMLEDSIAPTPIRQSVVRDNVFCARGIEELALELSSESDNFALFGTFDNNAYIHTSRGSGYLERRFLEGTPVPEARIDSMDLARWQSVSGQDGQSTETPVSAPITDAVLYLEPERITNGKFTTDVGGWSCWMLGGGSNQCVLSWNPLAGLNGGALDLGFSALIGSSYALTFQEIGSVTAGDRLLCTFSSRGLNAGAPAALELRQDASVSYDALSYPKLFEASPNREEHIVVLDVLDSDANARVDFGLEESTEKLLLDNVSIRRFASNETSLNQRFLLLSNPRSAAPLNITLTDSYVDASGTVFAVGSQIQLPPMGSKLLIRP